MMTSEDILIGDRVRYESAAGTIRGEVVDIEYDKNMAGDIVPWVIIRHTRFNRDCYGRLPGNFLSMYKFVVTFRDVRIQIARGEKVFA